MQLPFIISRYQKALSFMMPVSLFRNKSALHPYLEFLLYKNRIQLATEDAIYSDGDRYLPFRLAFKKIGKAWLQSLSSCLILGGGLGSIIQILHKQYNPATQYTMVELDPEILKYARLVLEKRKIASPQAHCEDGLDFIKKRGRAYQLICVDVFYGRQVPPAFLEKAFFGDIKANLAPGGIWVMNYIMQEEESWRRLWENASQFFTDISYIQKRENIILIGR
jgi:predicted membrane-bound spermidine synthase